jgi:hypothetical protein
MDKWIQSHIEDTIDMFANRIPYIEMNSINQSVVLDWPILLNQDSIWDMFDSKESMELYFNNICSLFMENYPHIELGIKYCMGPIRLDGDLYSRIVLYYYEKNIYQNTNTVFIA